MKTFNIPASRQSQRPEFSKQGIGQFQLASLEKLSDLTHRFQHLLRYRPKGMARLLPYYHYFLRLKDKLEHYCMRHQPGAPAPRGLPVSPPESPLLALSRLKDELAAFLAPGARVDLRKYSPALFLLFQELENLVREGCGTEELKSNHSAN